jgi:FMN reductase
MTTKKIVVVSSGLSQPSSTRLLADHLADATALAVRESGDDAAVEVIELRDLAHDIMNNLLTGFPSPVLKAAVDSVTAADAVIAVTPIFSSSYSGLFKSFFDVIEAKALSGKPMLLGATGGTARHSLALEYAVRPLFAYLQAVVVPTAVFAASDDWGATSSQEGDLSYRITRAAGELSELILGRSSVHGPSEETVVPFAQQLARLNASQQH